MPSRPGPGREPRRPRVPGDDPLDLLGAKRARLDLEALARDRGGRDGRRARGRRDLLAPAVEELHGKLRPVRPDGLEDTLVAGHDLLLVAGQRVGGQEPGRVHRGRLEDDEPRAAARAGLMVGDELVRRHVVVDERRLCAVEAMRFGLDRPNG